MEAAEKVKLKLKYRRREVTYKDVNGRLMAQDGPPVSGGTSKTSHSGGVGRRARRKSRWWNRRQGNSRD